MFEYVASGMSHTRITLDRCSTDLDVQIMIKDLVLSIQDKFNHKFSVLYNAYAESDFPKHFSRVFGNNVNTVHSDSGGLQVITQGKQFTPELKKQVYNNQAIYSDIAMSFDEIPVQNITNTHTKATAKNTKIFDPSRFEDCARKSGQNLKEQITIFQAKKDERRAKILPIIQGNSIDNYKVWHELVLAPISSDEFAIIGGRSVSTAALGMGIKEEIERIIAIENLGVDFDYCHLLGLGSVQRFLPLMILYHNGFLQHINAISYDSTTHTANGTMGRYFNKIGKHVAVGQYKNPTISLVIEDIYNNIAEFNPGFFTRYNIDLNEDLLFYTICQPSKFKSHCHYPISYQGVLLIVYLLSQVYNFIRVLDKASRNKRALKELINNFGGRDSHVLYSLLDSVKSIDDYHYWNKHIGNNLYSKRMSVKSPDILELF